MTKQITAKDIHDDFYGAEERLYVESVGLSKGSLVTKSDKADRLRKCGFGKSQPIQKEKELNEKRSMSGHMIHVIEYFRQYYPNNKFITEAEVKRLCEKYGLLLGETINYIGDVPEKNLQDIERFKLRKEDWREKILYNWYGLSGLSSEDTFDDYIAAYYSTGVLGLVQTKTRQSGRTQAQRDFLQQKNLLQQYIGGIDPYEKPKEKKEYEQPAFKICAPREDFETRGWEVRDGYRLVWDPIVLQPVSREGIDGYLIVTAWGDEASDPSVVNEVHN